jgi:hypothetical protein
LKTSINKTGNSLQHSSLLYANIHRMQNGNGNFMLGSFFFIGGNSMFRSKLPLLTAIINSMRRKKLFYNFFCPISRLPDTVNGNVIAVIDTIKSDLTFVAEKIGINNAKNACR